MSLPVAPTAEQLEASRAWVRSFFESYNGSGSAKDWVGRFFQPDAVVNSGNSSPTKGLKAIAENIDQQFTQLSTVKSDALHIDVLSDRIYVQEEVVFVVKNDPEQKKITLKGVDVLWKKVADEKASGMDIYIDETPLTEVIKKYSK